VKAVQTALLDVVVKRHALVIGSRVADERSETLAVLLTVENENRAILMISFSLAHCG
jgi:hypothetical protein